MATEGEIYGRIDNPDLTRLNHRVFDGQSNTADIQDIELSGMGLYYLTDYPGIGMCDDFASLAITSSDISFADSDGNLSSAPIQDVIAAANKTYPLPISEGGTGGQVDGLTTNFEESSLLVGYDTTNKRLYNREVNLLYDVLDGRYAKTSESSSNAFKYESIMASVTYFSLMLYSAVSLTYTEYSSDSATLSTSGGYLSASGIGTSFTSTLPKTTSACAKVTINGTTYNVPVSVFNWNSSITYPSTAMCHVYGNRYFSDLNGFLQVFAFARNQAILSISVSKITIA